MEYFQKSLKHSSHSVWSIDKHAALQKLAYEATSLTKLQEEALEVDKSNSYWSPPSCNRSLSGRQRVREGGTLSAGESSSSGRETSTERVVGQGVAMENEHEIPASSGPNNTTNRSRPKLQRTYCIVVCVYHGGKCIKLCPHFSPTLRKNNRSSSDQSSEAAEAPTLHAV